MPPSVTMLSVLPKPVAPCGTCVGRRWSRHGDLQGYVPPSGTGANGVLIVAEAAGADEEDAGQGLIGKAGYYLFSQLAKAGIDREGFRLANVLACRPPNNFLSKAPWEAEAIAHCAPLLAAEIASMKAARAAEGKDFCVLALGQIAFKALMGLDARSPILREDYQAYVHWSDRHACWVVAADHPAFLMRGQHQYVPVLQFAAQRALEVAREGFQYDAPTYLCDPPAAVFADWVREYRRHLGRHPSDTYLAIDIETPLKLKRDEAALAREEDEDYIILRCSFAWQVGQAVSVPWQAEYLPALEEIFGEPLSQYITWNGNYDIPRLKNQLTLRGVNLDAMLAWHVLNSQLDKRLGFVTPFYAKRARMWKHLSHAAPAFYNAADSDMALTNFLGIKADLERAGQWGVFDRHVIQLNRVLDHMSGVGIGRDEVMRQAAEVDLTARLDTIEGEMNAAVPQAARRMRIYAKMPKVTEGLVRVPVEAVVARCAVCGVLTPRAGHVKPVTRRAAKAGAVNRCEGAGVVKATETVERWARPEAFKVSKVGLSGYQASLKHQAVINRKENRVTFDEDAIRSLIRKYPKDPLYPLILNHREVQKILGTYVGTTLADGTVRGGLRVGRDGRIHVEYTHNPETLRLAAQNPNLQNLPRQGKAGAIGNVVRNLIVAGEGMTLLERDYSGIEAVLVAYFARWADGIRLAKLGMHAYLASHLLGRPADLKWPDEDLRQYFKEIKGSKDAHVQLQYNGAKRTVHLSGYGGTPRKMHQAEPDVFPSIAAAKRIQDIYWEVASPVRKWQLNTQLEAHANGHLRNPFGYVLRFTHVFRNVKEAGVWVRKPGEQANEALAFLPQSTAAGLIKEAMLRLYACDAVRPWMRLQVHDSLVHEVPVGLLEPVDALLREEMEKPIPELPLPASWAMGEALVIETDRKVGARWGEVK